MTEKPGSLCSCHSQRERMPQTFETLLEVCIKPKITPMQRETQKHPNTENRGEFIEFIFNQIHH